MSTRKHPSFIGRLRQLLPLVFLGALLWPGGLSQASALRSSWSAYWRWPALLQPSATSATGFAAAQTLTVTKLDDDGSTGTLRWAIGQANSTAGADTIEFQPGLSGTITLTAAAGGALTLSDTTGATTIQGPVSGGGITVSGNNLFRVFVINANVSATLNALTITGGNAGANQTGGGILSAGALTLTDCLITNNTAPGNGVGGGIASGGANAMLTLLRSTVSQNSARDGAGIFNNSQPFTFLDSTISDNTGSGQGNAAGFWNRYGTGTIIGCTISGNRSTVSGGISNEGDLTIVNSTISGNRADLAGSFAGNGGGIINQGPALRLYHCTVTGNVGSVGGGIQTQGGFHTVLKNTIVAGNVASFGGSSPYDLEKTGNDGYNDPVLGASTYNLIGSVTNSGGLTHGVNGNQVGNNGAGTLPLANLLNPALANNGGWTLTHALAVSSPALNAGSNLTTLNGAINDSTTTLTLANAGAFPAGANLVIRLDDEQLIVTGRSGNQLTVTRAANGTSAAAHSSGAGVNPAFDQRGSGFPRSSGAGLDLGAFETTASTPPAFTNCPAPAQTVNAEAGLCTAAVSFTPAATGFPTPAITCQIGATTITSTYNFPVGTTQVVCTASNGSAPDATCSFAVTVNDTQPPISAACPGTQTVTATSSLGAVVTFTPPSASDNCGSVPVACNPPSGSTFPVGTTNVVCTAQDAAMLTDMCNFDVVVNCPAVTVNPSNPALPAAAQGVPYNANFSQSGAVGTAVTFSLSSGNLPPGLTLAADGALTGTATESGSFNFTVSVSDSLRCGASRAYTLTVNCVPGPQVTNLNDSGPGSLREALAQACTGGTITFAPNLTGTLTLTSGELVIQRSLTIQGPGASVLTISGNHSHRVFTIQPAASGTVSLAGLRLSNGNGASALPANGFSGVGGAIFFWSSASTLTLLETEISGNTAGAGGGVATAGSSATVNLLGCTIAGNSGTTGDGGGLNLQASGTVNVINSTLAGNQAANGGGIGHSSNAALTLNLVNSTLTGNQAAFGGGVYYGTGLTIQARNSLVSLNTGNDLFGAGSFSSNGHNLLGTFGGSTSVSLQPTDQSGVNPLLALAGNNKPLLADNGGPTPTIRLLPGSPALDKGGMSYDPRDNQPILTDQRGLARPYDFPGLSPAADGNDSDIGAYEHHCTALTLAALPSGMSSAGYSASNVAGGGFAPYSLSLSGGMLPPGLSLSGNGLTGIPTQAGIYHFTLTGTDAYGCAGSQSYALAIDCPAVTLAPLSLPSVTVNSAYAQTLTATPAGGNYSFAVTSGFLPAGLTLNSNGSFSGAPVQSGTFTFRITATGFGGCAGFRDYTLLVLCPAISLSPASLPGGTLGQAYFQSISASPAGLYSYSVTSGALPAGLTLNSANGSISGTPTVSGTLSFTITAAAGGCAGSRSYTVQISCAGVSLTPASLAGAQAGVAYNATIQASGATSYNLLAGNLPPGLNLNLATGQLSGTATATGSYNFTVQATAAGGCSGTQSYSLVVSCPTLTVNPATLPNGTTGTAYHQTLSATPAGNYSFSKTSGSLPPGLTLNSAAGSLSGTPTTTGSYTFTVTATGFGTCAGSRSYTITVTASCATITLPVLPATGTVGVNYSGNLAATTPSATYTFTVESGALPPGLAINNLFGLLSGKPTAPGTYGFTLKATRSNGCTGTRAYTVVISGASFVRRRHDFDGDGKSDLVWRLAGRSEWLLTLSGSGETETVNFGAAADVPALGDYDGDGRTDLAVYRQAEARWLVRLSSTGTAFEQVWPELPADAQLAPVAADYDGDGRTDLALWESATATWHLARSRDGKRLSLAFGTAGDIAVPADYDGDGRADLAVFERGSARWRIHQTSDGATVEQQFGAAKDEPLAADFDGDGRADRAVWRVAEGALYLQPSGLAQTARVSLSWPATAPGLLLLLGDYDGDGRTEVALRRAAEGRWYLRALEQTEITGQPQPR
jgi:hypothetical protein